MRSFALALLLGFLPGPIDAAPSTTEQDFRSEEKLYCSGSEGIITMNVLWMRLDMEISDLDVIKGIEGITCGLISSQDVGWIHSRGFKKTSRFPALQVHRVTFEKFRLLENDSGYGLETGATLLRWRWEKVK